MKVSLNTIKQLVNFELPPVDELVARINAQLGGVEEIIDLGERYKDARIVRVVSAEKHPDADKLTVCKVDDGGTVQDIERDENGYAQVVCGAPNARADIWAVWLPPSATIPSTFDDAEPFVLDARKLRGVMSYGMLAAGDELAISSDHEGIIEITEVDLAKGKELVVGASFAETFDLDDTIIDIENKMFTHRPDCFGQLGVAREIAGIFGEQFESPKWYQELPNFADGAGLELSVFNEADEKAPRFMAVALKDIEVKPSPLWLQTTLVRWGSKAINNIVDATNYIMLLTAQPTHAYDYNKLRGGTLGVRMAREGEKVTLLNGKTYDLSDEDIVIADKEGSVGLAGIMGSGESEVDNDTRNIVLEVANFDMYTLRKSAMRHGLFTDALTRFNKGQSPLQNPYVLGRLMRLTGGAQASAVFDNMGDAVKAKVQVGEPTPPLTIKPDFIRERLGADISKHDMVRMISNVEFPLCEDCGWNPKDRQDNIDDLHVNVPFWRTDIEEAEDVVEEIGRLHGFDALPRELPLRSTKPAQKNALRRTKQSIRASLSQAGANEVLTYSFVHENTLKKAEQDVAQAFKLSNALSPGLQYYRLTVLPSLLDKVHMNIKAGHDEFVLFEIGKGHNKKYHADDDNGLPKEMQFVDAVYASRQPREGAPYYYMRRLVSQLAQDHGFTLRFKPIAEPLDYPVAAPFDLSRSALVETWDGDFVGMIGELKQSVIRNFKLPQHVAAMTLDLESFHEIAKKPRATYLPLSKYPAINRDISIAVDDGVSYEKLRLAANDYLDNIGEDVHIEPIGAYKSKGSTTKNITFHIRITSHDQTLSSEQANEIVTKITDAMCQVTGGTVI